MSLPNHQLSQTETQPNDRPRLGASLSLNNISRWLKIGALVVLLLLLVLGPDYLNTYDLLLAFSLFNYMTLAESWNLLGGYGGQFSLGHSLFVGVGSYTVAVLLLHSSMPLFLSILLSGVVASLLAVIAALLLMRLRGDYFAIGSLGITIAGLTWMINWSYTGATSGLNLPPTSTLPYSTLYYTSLALLVFTMICIVLLIHSPFGLRLMAIRDDEDAAAELGVYSLPVKLTTFAISAFFAGIAGSLIALNALSIEPDSAFSINWVMTMIIITVIGGMATSTGPLIGAVVVFTLQQALQGYENLSSLLTGILLILIIRLAPDGIWKTMMYGFQKLANTTLKQHTTNH
jgi:branched-chain amino acid transport system permease protein